MVGAHGNVAGTVIGAVGDVGAHGEGFGILLGMGIGTNRDGVLAGLKNIASTGSLLGMGIGKELIFLRNGEADGPGDAAGEFLSLSEVDQIHFLMLPF